MGIESATPRMTYTGPLIKDKVAFTESFEYRYVRTPVNSLPAAERDQNLEGFNSYTQFDFNISNKQTATVSVAVYPQKLQYMGLNTFTPQPATADYHQRGYQIYAQHRWLTGSDSSLVSQFSYKNIRCRYDCPEGPVPINWGSTPPMAAPLTGRADARIVTSGRRATTSRPGNFSARITLRWDGLCLLLV